MALTSIEAIEAEIKQLEAQKKLIGRRDAEVGKALEVLAKFAQVLTSAQRRQIARIAGDDVSAAPAKTAKRAAKPAAKVAPKYRLPSGETWSGRGPRPPRVFSDWLATKEGQAWAQANPDLKYPLASGGASAQKTAAKKSAGRNTAVKKATKKSAGRKAVKKTAKKTAKKASKRTKVAQ